MSDECFINTEEAAKFLSVSPRSLEAFRCRNGGPKYYKPVRQGPGRSGMVRYRRSDLIEWMEAGERRSTDDDPL